MHERCAPHADDALQGAPAAPYVPHTREGERQTRSCVPHEARLAQESPGVGAGAQVPHASFRGTAQKPVTHWAGKAQAEPLASAPVGWAQAAGGLAVLK